MELVGTAVIVRTCGQQYPRHHNFIEISAAAYLERRVLCVVYYMPCDMVVWRSDATAVGYSRRSIVLGGGSFNWVDFYATNFFSFHTSIFEFRIFCPQLGGKCWPISSGSSVLFLKFDD